MPFFCASCSHPPALASPPCFSAYPLTLSSSSGLKCRTRPCKGHAKASPSARENVSIYMILFLPFGNGDGAEHTADSMTLNLFGKFLQHINLPLPRLSSFESLHDLLRPFAAFSTRCALAATLMSVKSSESGNSSNDISAFVHDDDGGCAKPGLGILERVEIH